MGRATHVYLSLQVFGSETYTPHHLPGTRLRTNCMIHPDAPSRKAWDLILVRFNTAQRVVQLSLSHLVSCHAQGLTLLLTAAMTPVDLAFGVSYSAEPSTLQTTMNAVDVFLVL